MLPFSYWRRGLFIYNKSELKVYTVLYREGLVREDVGKNIVKNNSNFKRGTVTNEKENHKLTYNNFTDV
jgi:hypothetical protein